MFVLMYILIALLLFAPPFEVPSKSDGEKIHPGYISRESTAAIKGVFVFIVFCSHFQDYVTLPEGVWNDAFIGMRRTLSQLMVTPFLFYSGYGLYISLLKKGSAYVHTFFRKRLFPLWLYFAFCIFLYYISGILHGQQFGWKTLLLALTGWSSIGNSNWFMFDTFVLYILFITVFLHLRKERENLDLLLWIFTSEVVILSVLLYFTKEPWWFNTILCFPAGMWYGRCQETIDRFFSAHYVWGLGGLILLFLPAYHYRHHLPIYILHGILFILIIVCISMKCRFSSYVCSFLGAHVFSVYMLQRLAFSNLWHYITNPYLFFLSSFAATIAAAVILDWIYDNLKTRLLS